MTNSEHDDLHERFDRLHTTSAANALMDYHHEHGGCAYKHEPLTQEPEDYGGAV